MVAICCASCAAPDGMTRAPGKPAAAAQSDMQAMTEGWAATGGMLDMTVTRASSSRNRSAAEWSSACTAAAMASMTFWDMSRSSTVKRHSPGTTFGTFGVTCTDPRVHTVLFKRRRG